MARAGVKEPWYLGESEAGQAVALVDFLPLFPGHPCSLSRPTCSGAQQLSSTRGHHTWSCADKGGWRQQIREDGWRWESSSHYCRIQASPIFQGLGVSHLIGNELRNLPSLARRNKLLGSITFLYATEQKLCRQNSISCTIVRLPICVDWLFKVWDSLFFQGYPFLWDSYRMKQLRMSLLFSFCLTVLPELGSWLLTHHLEANSNMLFFAICKKHQQ